MEYLKVPKSKSIKIFIWDDYKMEKRTIELDGLLTLINSGRFNGDLSQDHIYYYRTSKERDWYAKRSIQEQESFMKKVKELGIWKFMKIKMPQYI